MKKIIILFIVLIIVKIAFSQSSIIIENRYSSFFSEAYTNYPALPNGILEAVSYSNTRFENIDSSFAESCIGLPRVYGVMGLVLDGKNYFRNNLIYISEISGYNIEDIINIPRINILAYAKAFNILKFEKNINSNKPEEYTEILIALSELPISDKNNLGNDFAINSYLYSVLTFLYNTEFQNLYNFQKYDINFESFFGENLKILTAPKVKITGDIIINNNGDVYKSANKTACPDYPFSNCSWIASPNYSSRNGTTISALAMHTVQGSYSGCISWFQNSSANASTQYVVRSSDGQLTQMVTEANKAWHVGSENPYTIGYEHEGWVDNASWYTPAMYQSSANLTRDICNDWNIDPFRMFYRDTLDGGTVLDYGVHSLGAEGSCVKIKGHQHFPNQTHTDPGPNWNWDLYFKLVNQNSTSVTTLTSSSGNFYDTGGSGANYTDDERKFWLIKPTNASQVTISFSSFSMETNYDFMYIYDGESEFAPLIGRFNTQSPGTITSSGSALFIEFRSDCATTASGWIATYTSTSIDNIAPTTSIATSGTWKTADFTATFTDNDNSGGSGLEKSFYQVLEFDGTEWGANEGRGFFADNFDNSLNSKWTTSVGTWSTTGGSLVQSDESQSNTNIYASLTQSLSNRSLYHFYAKAEGSGTNKRFGFHFFSDNGSLANRGNSYFVWFRIEGQTLEFFKCVNDAFTTAEYVVNNVVTVVGQWYDYKIIYDRTTGKTDVYRDNILLGSYTYTSPYSDGAYISFRSGNCQMSVNELKVYRSRYSTVDVAVGQATTNDIRTQNPSPSTFGAKIKSIVNDANGNLSSIAYHDLNVDYSAPTTILTVNDGSGIDIDTIAVTSSLTANWTASDDPNSGLKRYWYSIGTSSGSVDVTNWTDNELLTSVTQSGLSLNPSVTYYFNIKSENEAGLISAVTSSDGQLLANSTNAGFIASTTEVCIGDTVYFTNSSTDAVSYNWTFDGAETVNSSLTNPFVIYNNQGVYNVTLNAYGLIDSVTLLQSNYITVNALAIADFGINDTLLFLPGALALFQNTSTNANYYLWNFGDGFTSTDQIPWHIYDTTGYFTVSLIAYNNLCGSDTLVKPNYIHVDILSGNELNILVNDLKVFPNPFSSNFTISFRVLNDGIYSFKLLDIKGSEIVIVNNLKYNKGTYKLEIDDKACSEGLYFLMVEGGGDINYYKITKIK